MLPADELETLRADISCHARESRAKSLNQLSLGSCAVAQGSYHAPHPLQIRIQGRHPANDTDGWVRAGESLQLSRKTSANQIQRVRREELWIQVRKNIAEHPVQRVDVW